MEISRKERARTIRNLRNNIGRKMRIFNSNDYIVDGVLIKSPVQEDRSDFCIAFLSDVPRYKSGVGESVGRSIEYLFLRTEFLRDVHLSYPDEKMLLARTYDPYFPAGGGGVYHPKDLAVIAKYFPEVNAINLAGSFVRTSDIS